MIDKWLLPSMKKDKVEKLFFMQDGAKIHTSNYTSYFLKDHNVKVLKKWPPFSPDINPIENVWSMLKKKLKEKYRKKGLPKDSTEFFADACYFFKIICAITIENLIQNLLSINKI